MPRPDEPVRVALLHPYRTWRAALGHLLQADPGIEVVAAEPDATSLVRALARKDADVVLLGLERGREDLDAVRGMAAADERRLRLVIMAETGDPELVADCVRAGARGWLSPSASLEDLLSTVQAVGRRGTRMPDDVVGVLLDHLFEADSDEDEPGNVLAALSRREREILDRLAQGRSRAEIAEELFLSPHTVRTHIHHLLRKLDVHSTLAAVAIARRWAVPSQRPPS